MHPIHALDVGDLRLKLLWQASECIIMGCEPFV